jgi:DNA-binding NarL/FixJ family response regulator
MAGRAPTILIVEADPMSAANLRETLAGLGYDVMAVVSSPEDAISLAGRRRPDLLLMDINIGGALDGTHAAAILRHEYGLPVVYLTTIADHAIVERTSETEAYGYLVKPVRPVELQSVIELALHQHEMENRLRERAQWHGPPAGPPAAAADTSMRRQPAATGPATRRSTVLLADDHAMLREGIAKLLTDHDFEVVGTVGDADQLLDAARRVRPDVILTDISMPPGLSGLDVIDRLKTERIDSKVIVLTMHDDADLATRAARAGAAGFVLKYAAGEELVTAIQQALQGRVYFSPVVTRGVLERLAAPAGPSEPLLSPRQIDVLRLILDGHRMKEIAAVLDLSPRTVETHKYDMMRTLGVRSTAELIKYAIEKRLIVQ